MISNHCRLLLAESGMEYVENNVSGKIFAEIKDDIPFGKLPILGAFFT
jgi:hypothetical protein